MIKIVTKNSKITNNLLIYLNDGIKEYLSDETTKTDWSKYKDFFEKAIKGYHEIDFLLALTIGEEASRLWEKHKADQKKNRKKRR